MRATDWLLLLAAAALVVLGPAMAAQELSRLQDAQSLASLTGSAPAEDYAYRLPWRAATFGLVVGVGVVGTLVALRVARQPRVRAVSGRLLALLLTGMTLLDLAWLAEGRWLLAAPHAVRAGVVAWLYPLAALLLVGSVLRLSEVEAYFREGGRLDAARAG